MDLPKSAVSDATPPSTHTGFVEPHEEHEHEEHVDAADKVTARDTVDVQELVHVEPVREEPTEQEQIEAALSAHPELASIARPAVAVLLAGEKRPLPVVRRALAELAAVVRDGAAVGQRVSPAALTTRARAFVRCAFADPTGTSTPSPATTSTPRPSSPETPEPPPMPPRLAESRQYLRGMLAAIGSTRPSRPS